MELQKIQKYKNGTPKWASKIQNKNGPPKCLGKLPGQNAWANGVAHVSGWVSPQVLVCLGFSSVGKSLWRGIGL